MKQKQRIGDLEEELELLHKQLRITKMKVVEQVKHLLFLCIKKENFSFLFSHKKLEI